MDKKLYALLVKKYLKGECTEVEKQLVEKYFDALQATDKVEAFDATQLAQSKHTTFAAIQANIALQAPLVREHAKPLMKPNRVLPLPNFFVRLAASLLLFMGLAWLVYTQWDGFSTATYAEVVTPKGKTTKLSLPDGTVVWLNADSRFRYPKSFSPATRDVYLEGEAYFAVAKNPNQPFIVHTQQLATKVLGTHFDVRAYNDDATEQITVVEGKVQVSKSESEEADPATQPVLLTANQQATYQLSEQALRKNGVDATEFVAWKEGSLQFNKTPLSEVVKQLARRYDLVITVKNPQLLSCGITARFDNQSAERAIRQIALVLNVRYTINGKEVIFEGKGC